MSNQNELIQEILSTGPRNSAIPPVAQWELISCLVQNVSSDMDSMVEIVKRHGVSVDTEALETASFRSLIQRFLSRFKDKEGKRLFLGNKGSYHYIPCCEDLTILDEIEQRLQHQAASLNRTSDIVSRRIDVLRRMLGSLKTAQETTYAQREAEEDAP